MAWIKRIIRLVARPLSQNQKAKIWRALIRFRYRVHTKLGEYPGLLFWLYSRFNLYQHYCVDNSSGLVIDAFPRSGSTFALYAFLLAQKDNPVKVAYHLHVPAHIIKAIKLNIPALVIIRHPKEAVSSAIIREPYLSIREYLRRYRSFYKTLESYRDSFVVVDFEQITQHLDAVIELLNKKYGTTFTPFEYTAENLELVEQQMHLRHQDFGGGQLQSYLPAPEKRIAKASVDFNGNLSLLEECEAIYNRYMGYLEK